jgi:molybdopterin synthase catalytic subunit
MSISVQLVSGALDAAPAPWHVAGAGAHVCFEGVVRPSEDGRPIDALLYEAYEPMATQMLERIAGELVARHALLGMRIEHSAGRVAVGACSFRLRVAAAHRQQALAAVAEFIELLKRDVPIWKTAVHQGGAIPH